MITRRNSAQNCITSCQQWFEAASDQHWRVPPSQIGCCLRVRHVLRMRRLQPCGEDLRLQVVSASPGGDVWKWASHMSPPCCEEALFSSIHGPVRLDICLQKVPLGASKSASSGHSIRGCYGLILHILMYTWKTRRKEFHRKRPEFIKCRRQSELC